jgi:hypothetical protein
MPVALPVVTRREIARELQLGEEISEPSALRRLKSQHALSPGLAVVRRGPGGKVEGRLHLYSALNRDAARALRHGRPDVAGKLVRAAVKVEQSPHLKRVVASLAEGGSIDTTAQLVKALSAPELLDDVSVLEDRTAKARARYEAVLGTVMLAGRIADLTPDRARVRFLDQMDLVTLPRAAVEDAGVAAVGSAVCAVWEYVHGRTVLSVEPALDVPGRASTGEPLADVYGTPWGAIAVAPEMLNATGRATISIPAGIPDVA